MNRVCAGLLVLACLSGSAIADTPFRLGVQTHFEQGWNQRLISAARRLGAPAVRDEIGWSTVEKTPGVYDFSVPDKYMRLILKSSLTPLIVVTDTNPLYDDGQTPFSRQGRAGLADFLNAAVERYGDGRIVLEIGNEPNSDDFVNGPFASNAPAYLAALVRQVRKTVKADHPDTQVVCAGVNTIAIGFLREFFRQGGLVACDAISVHPYRDNPDTVGVELERLRAVMDEFGGAKPIYATEFGKWFDDAEDAPDYMLKMVTQMAAADVVEAYWYALADEPWWPNMGLVDKHGKDKPAAQAFAFLQEQLLPLGRPRSHATDSTTRLFEFGDTGQAFALWGADAAITVAGQARYFDSWGRPIAPVDRLSDQPVVIIGTDLSVRIDRPATVADTAYQYNRAPWSYFALRPDIGLTPLEIIDGKWASRRSAPDLSPLQIGPDWITTARFNDQPYHAVERFTAQVDGVHRIDGWWQGGDKVEATMIGVLHNRQPIAEGAVSAQRFAVQGLEIMMQAGDTLDFELSPAGPGGDGAARRRIVISGPPPAD